MLHSKYIITSLDEIKQNWSILRTQETHTNNYKYSVLGSNAQNSAESMLLFSGQNMFSFAKEVDIRSLGLQQLKNLLEKLVKNAEEDNENFLLRLKNRIDR